MKKVAQMSKKKADKVAKVAAKTAAKGAAKKAKAKKSRDAHDDNADRVDEGAGVIDEPIVGSDVSVDDVQSEVDAFEATS